MTDEEGLDTADANAVAKAYTVEAPTNPYSLPNLYDGAGTISVKLFELSKAAQPANFVLYEIPPGASEGVHLHGADDANGAFEEFYYIVAGEGCMSIDDDEVTVRAGELVHVGLGARRGIANRSTETLKVFMTYLLRPGGEAA